MITNMLPRVWISNEEETWQCHWNTAIANIRKEYKLSSDIQAEDMLSNATINNPIKVDNVLMWLR